MDLDLSHLNKEQSEAVQHENGPLLVVAGAGTGKTTVLISRLLYLISAKKLTGEEVLLTTFTEKAARELEDRATKELPYGYFNLWINTFHGFCERLLKEHGLDIGLPGDFKLLDQAQQWILIHNNLEQFDLDYYAPLGNSTKFIHELVKHFSRLKDEDIWPQDYLDYVLELEQNSDQMLTGLDKDEQNQEVNRLKELANAYHIYNKLLLENSFLDFGDLIIYTLKLFRERPQILKLYQQKFKQVMVDEFQDTNWAQYELVKMLSRGHGNLTVVGDDDQSIYRFRGSSIFNIMQFKDDYPKAKEIVLTKNYRSGQNILNHAYISIKKNNPNRLEEKIKISKELKSQTETKGQVEHWHLQNEESETAFVRDKIQEIYNSNKNVNWSDFAILVRANSSASKFVQELDRHGIPNLFVSLKGLYYKPLILNAIAYFKLLDNYHESSALFRVLNFDHFSIGHKNIMALNRFARKKTWSLYETLENAQVVPEVSAESIQKINQLLILINKHSTLAKTESASKIFLGYVKDFSIIPDLDKDKDKEKFSWLNQFYKKLKSFEAADTDVKLKEVVNLINLELEAGESGSLQLEFEDPDVVKVMTVHSAKGLEFKYVFVCTLVDKRFPTINRTDKIQIPDELVKEAISSDKNFHIEEERRLFYVAITRAKEHLYLTSAKDYGGKLEKKPSPFIAEMELTARETFGVENQTMNELEKDLDKQKDKLKVKKTIYSLPGKFSFSQLEAYSKCPWQYLFSFILRVPIPDKASLSFGKTLHNTLYDYLQPLAARTGLQGDLFGGEDNNDIDLSEKKLLALYQEKWLDGGYRNKKEKEDYFKKGKEIVKSFSQMMQTEKPEPVYLEKDFSFKLQEFMIKGAIDRIDKLSDGTIEVIDYKTGKPKDKLDKKSKRQLMIYQLALQSIEEFKDFKISKLSYLYLNNNQLVSFVAAPKDLEKLEQELLAEMKEITTLNFTPKPSALVCGNCDFNGICEFRKF